MSGASVTPSDAGAVSRERRGGTLRYLAAGYVQQLISLGTLVGFNLLLPRMVGLQVFGEFTTTQGLLFMVTGLAAGGFDVVALRELPRGDGELARGVIWRLVAMKLVVLGPIGAVLVLARHRVFPGVAVDNWFVAWTLALGLGLSLSSLLINVYVAAFRNDLAARLSALHSVLYVGLPLAACVVFGRTATSVVAGVAVSYAAIVVLEVRGLSRLTWAAAARPFVWQLAARDAVLLGAPNTFDAVRSWAPFYVAGFFFPAPVIAVAKIAYSAAMGAAALVPAPQQSLVVLASRISSERRLREQVFRAVRVSAVAGSLGVTAMLLALAGVLYRSSMTEFIAVAPIALACALVMPMSRVAVALRSAGPNVAALALRLGAAGVVVIGGALALPPLLGSRGVLLAAMAGSLAAVLLIDRELLALQFGPVEQGVTAIAIGTLVFAPKMAPRYEPWPFVALLGSLALAYAVYHLRPLLRARRAMTP